MNRTTAWAPVVLGVITLAVVALLVLAFWPRDADTPPGTPSQRTDDSTASTDSPNPQSSGDAEPPTTRLPTTNIPATNIPPGKRPVPSRTPSPPKEGAVFGIVSDTRGNPVPGASISLRFFSGGQTRTTTADDNGHYRISHPRPGIALLEARGPDPTDGFARGAVEFTIGSEIGWDPVLETKHAIFGTVVDNDGLILPGVEVSARLRDRRRSATTGPDGRFVIHPCRDEPHELVVVTISTVYHEPSPSTSPLVADDDSVPRIVSLDSVRPGPDPVLLRVERERPRTTTIEGRLVAADEHAPTDYQVRIVFDALLADLDSFGDPTCEIIRPDADGTFRSRPLEAGPYSIWVETRESIHAWEASRIVAEPETDSSAT